MAKTETGWTKEYPSLQYGSRFFLRHSPDAEPELHQLTGGRKWMESFGIVRNTTEFLGPVTAADFEQLTRLRELCAEARDVLALLVPYGKIHTVEGVRYPDGSHSEAVDRGERVLNKLRDIIGKD